MGCPYLIVGVVTQLPNVLAYPSGLLCFGAGTNGTYNRTEQPLQDKTQ